MGEIAFYDLPAHYYNEYLDWIEAVTLDDVRRVAAARFPSGEPAILVLGRAAEILGQLEKLGPVTVEAL
jgi:predicted Zn-dependent peptidase